jgi:prophage regulatory protein
MQADHPNRIADPRFALNPILREPQAVEASGSPRSTFRRDVKAGTMTQPVKIGKRSSGWPAHEVAVINAAKIAGQSEDEIKTLVERLHANRPRLLAEFEQYLAG